MSQPQSEASETNIESSSVLLDLLRDHNSDIGNWCEIVNENQEMPVATIESFKSSDTIDENGPFYIFASNLNLRIQQKSNSFELPIQEQIYQYFGGKENLYSVYMYSPWTKGCCMLNARNFEACIRILQKDGELFREKPVKLEYVSNTNSMKYIRFDHRQLDAQMQMYKMAHPPPPPEVPKPKPNPFGDAKPVNTKEKLKKLEDKLLRDEDRSYHQANLTTLQDQGQQQPKVNVVQPQQPPRILHHSDSHGSGGGRVFKNSNMSGHHRPHIPYEGGEGKEEMRNRTSTGPISSQSNNDRQKNRQHSSSQQSNPRNQQDGGQHRILQTSLKAALNNDKNQRNYNPKGGNRSQNWHESGEEKGKTGGGTGTSSGPNPKSRPRPQHYDRTYRYHQLHSNQSNSNVSNNSSKRDDNTSIGDSGSDAHVGEQKKLEHQKPPKHGTQEKQPDNNESLGKEKGIADEKFHESKEKLPKQISDEKQDDKTTVENNSNGENVQKEQPQLENTLAPTASNNHERSAKNKKKKPNKRGNGKNQDQGVKQNNRFDALSNNTNMNMDG